MPHRDRNTPIRYAVVGAGHIAQVAVLPAFDNAENSRLVGLVSGDEAKQRELGERHQIEEVVSYDDYDAINFTNTGDTVTVEVHAEPDTARLVVSDTGEGFEPHSAGKLFEPFQQGPQDLSRSTGGLGLGLALVRGLVELHGGTVRAHSEGKGRGATFEVRLPVQRATRDTASDEGASEPRARRILIVEDNEDAAAMLRMVLELAGHEVHTVPSGVEGIAWARERRPDFVLCDIGLPGGVSGFDVAKALRSDPRTRPLRLVAISGYGRREDEVRSLEAGFDAHLTKPVDTEALRKILAGGPR